MGQSPCTPTTEPALESLQAATTEALLYKARAPQQEKPPQQEAHTPHLKNNPHSPQLEKACM